MKIIPRLQPLVIALALATALGLKSLQAEEGTIAQIAEQVRAPAKQKVPEENPEPAKPRPDSTQPSSSKSPLSEDEQASNGLSTLATYGTMLAVTAPFWGPRAILGDDGEMGMFPNYPYDRVKGHMLTGEFPTEPEPNAGGFFGLGRLWKKDTDPDEPTESIVLDRWRERGRTDAGRISFEYGDQFDSMNKVGGNLLLTSAERGCYEARWDYYQERRPGKRFDYLNIGDFNVEYRFAQSHHAEFRSGIGFNWMQDRVRSDFGFNFIYGADFFPAQPWILSTTIDWGTLGNSDLFRARATAGVIIRSIETYAGYEYLDIGRTGISALIAGVRWWF